ncbi:spermidine synthase [Corynebacterium humireducens NBRC 106098 = DSM 45392]|uniref:Spermidine synthase n=1 Tax=Corynebacterium humireducens NBRC 106098 = DSM 45392 TaxID=1223515 RepID=A0A0B5DB53_9CORY|nr:fused MFS/spermidine synthase [Corynebacterium humireducens]AJE32959.1 spermidine synthase [Corynebacterium humireducens NBRC 106098 = DSM 45392]
MARSRKSRSSSTPAATGAVAGRYEISTGTAELVPDTFLPDAWTLMINGVPSSHVQIGRPDVLEFEYMRWIAAGVEKLVAAHHDPATVRVTHLGGAACSMARYFADLWPSSRHTVVELDAKLAAYVREWFDIPRAPTVKIRVGEAGEVTRGFYPGSREVIIRDVFAGARTPLDLTTPDFFRAAHAALVPGGLYVANCGDFHSLVATRTELAGMAEVFAHVAVIADPPMLKGRRSGNIILLGSDRELPVEGSPEAAALGRVLLGGAVPAHYRDERWTRALFDGTPPRILATAQDRHDHADNPAISLVETPESR